MNINDYFAKKFALSASTATGGLVHRPPVTAPTDDKSSILDPIAFPGIVVNIVAFSDHKTHVAIWGVNSALYGHLAAHFYSHLSRQCRGLAPSKTEVVF